MNQAWLRKASMKRLNTLVIDKKEVIGHKLAFCSNIDVEDLEPSGLSDAEKFQIHRWFEGHQSGRQCMLALLECHMKEISEKKEKSTSATNKAAHMSCGAPGQVAEFNILSKSIDLPENFLCDSGFMCEAVFSKPPNTVLKEALQILSQYAMEKSSTALTVEQINLSLKQMRIDKLKSHRQSEDSTNDTFSIDSENVEINKLQEIGMFFISTCGSNDYLYRKGQRKRRKLSIQGRVLSSSDFTRAVASPHIKGGCCCSVTLQQPGSFSVGIESSSEKGTSPS